MTDYELDQLICDALLDAIGIDFQEELSSDIVIPISEEYQQSVRHMFDEMQNTKKHAKRARRKKYLRRISGIAACLLLVGTVTIMIPSVKAAIQKWWIQWSEQGELSFIFTGETRTKSLPKYEIEDLPMGYEQADDTEFFFELYREIVYQDDCGREIVLTYGDMFQGAELRIHTGGVSEKVITVNDCEGILLPQNDENDMCYLFWVDEHAELQFILKAPVDEETLLEMAESIVEISD